MPIYIYQCEKCGYKFELLIGVTQKEEELKCKKCGSREISKIWGGFNIGKVSSKKGPSCSAGSCPTCY